MNVQIHYQYKSLNPLKSSNPLFKVFKIKNISTFLSFCEDKTIFNQFLTYDYNIKLISILALWVQ